MLKIDTRAAKQALYMIL